MVFAIIIVAVLLAPLVLVAGLVTADEVEWQRFKRETGIR